MEINAIKKLCATEKYLGYLKHHARTRPVLVHTMVSTYHEYDFCKPDTGLTQAYLDNIITCIIILMDLLMMAIEG